MNEITKSYELTTDAAGNSHFIAAKERGKRLLVDITPSWWKDKANAHAAIVVMRVVDELIPADPPAHASNIRGYMVDDNSVKIIIEPNEAFSAEHHAKKTEQVKAALESAGNRRFTVIEVIPREPPTKSDSVFRRLSLFVLALKPWRVGTYPRG